MRERRIFCVIAYLWYEMTADSRQRTADSKNARLLAGSSFLSPSRSVGVERGQCGYRAFDLFGAPVE